jgi:hypothetical protein
LIDVNNPNFIPDIMAGALFIVPLFIALRAFYIYSQTRSPRLFVLALAMALIALTAADNFFVNIVTVPYNTYWFLYIGQTVAYFFILLSFFWSSEQKQQNLIRWQIIATVLMIIVWLLSPVLPPFPNVMVRAALSGARAVMCLGIFLFYVSAFMKKETRFSFMMSSSFLLLAIGQWLVAQKYFLPGQLIDNMGDITRLIGLAILLFAVITG